MPLSNVGGCHAPAAFPLHDPGETRYHSPLCYLMTNTCCFHFTEANFGKDGRANLLQLLDLNEEVNWPELESLYRLNESVYDYRLNYNVSLEDWMNFDAKVDRGCCTVMQSE